MACGRSRRRARTSSGSRPPCQHQLAERRRQNSAHVGDRARPGERRESAAPARRRSEHTRRAQPNRASCRERRRTVTDCDHSEALRREVTRRGVPGVWTGGHDLRTLLRRGWRGARLGCARCSRARGQAQGRHARRNAPVTHGGIARVRPLGVSRGRRAKP
jgi:hypothetical protein